MKFYVTYNYAMFNSDGTLYTKCDGKLGIGGGVEASFDTLEECKQFILNKQEDVDMTNLGKICKPSWWLGAFIVKRYDPSERAPQYVERCNMCDGVYQLTTYSICNFEA